MPKISIITPCYNAEKFILPNIRSVNEQTFRDWERIFVNDGSTDRTETLIAGAIAGDSRQRLLTIANQGVCFARNYGFAETCKDSEYIIFLDADDLYHPAFIEEMVKALDNDPSAGVVYCDNYFIDELDRRCGSLDWPRLVPTRWGIRSIPENIPYTPFVSIYCWTKITEGMPLLRRSVFERSGGWSPDLYYGEGIYLYSHISFFSKVIYLDEKLYYYRRHSGQVTHHLPDHQQQSKKIERKILELAKKVYPESVKKVEQAAFFRNYRIQAHRQFGEVLRQIKKKRFLTAIKLLIHALLNFIKSFRTDYGEIRKDKLLTS